MDTDVRREEFVRAASDLFMEKGARDTSVTDIAKRVGVTRSLFYHYFDDKFAIIDAVIDSLAEDFLERTTEWDMNFDHANARKSILAVVSLVRSFLFDEGQLAETILRDNNPGLRQQFSVRVASYLSSKLEAKRKEKGTPSWADELPHPRESYYVLCVGVLSLMTREPEIDDELVADLIADIMHIHV